MYEWKSRGVIQEDSMLVGDCGWVSLLTLETDMRSHTRQERSLCERYTM